MVNLFQALTKGLGFELPNALAEGRMGLDIRLEILD
jgi:hypothetical protein